MAAALLAAYPMNPNRVVDLLLAAALPVLVLLVLLLVAAASLLHWLNDNKDRKLAPPAQEIRRHR